MLRIRRKVKKRDKKQKSIGGVPFFITLGCALFLGVFNFFHLPALWDGPAFRNWCKFLSGMVLGGLIAKVMIQGHISVFCHELKHMLVSKIWANNKNKGFKIRRKSGHYKYAYSRETEKFNALISLAPYFFPLFTVPAALIAWPISYHSPHWITFILGVGYGIDCLLNVRDISPIQTDLTEITGGYNTAIAFVIAINLTIFTLLAAFVSQGVFGLQFLVHALWDFMIHIVNYYRSL